MSKELEAFRDILGILSVVSGCEVDMNSERVKIVEQALQRLEAIDNANPSEAINFIDVLLNARLSDKHFINVGNHETWLELANIKQALLKAQEQEKEIEVPEK